MVAWCGLLAALLFVPGRIARAQGTAVRLISTVNHTFSEPARHESQPRWLLGFVFLALALLGISLAHRFQVFQGTVGKLHVYFLDVGQADSILIVTLKENRCWWTVDRI
jgi:beta-lactamase superfamily II metal-dependent hydrolase